MVIEVGCFVSVEGEEGIEKGLVIANQPLPEDENDPYNLRLKFVVMPLKDDHIISHKAVLLDPNQLKIFPEEEQKRLRDIMKQDFKDEVEVYDQSSRVLN